MQDKSAVPTSIEIFEVGPRDGLQNEPKWVSVEQKVRLVEMLADCGFLRIEVGSFVNPKRVPQMAGTADVFRKIVRKPGVSYCALVPNLRGLEDALAAEVSEIAVFASATEGFSHANVGSSVADCLKKIRAVADSASAVGLRTRGYVSCVLECPYDGPTEPQRVLRAAEALLEFGCYEVSLGDTIGRGAPEQLQRLLGILLAKHDPSRFAGHFHDTSGRALSNVEIAIGCGIGVIDASIAGLGGCPFAPGAAGNIATEAVCDMLTGHGIATGLDRGLLGRCAGFASELLCDS